MTGAGRGNFDKIFFVQFIADILSKNLTIIGGAGGRVKSGGGEKATINTIFVGINSVFVNFNLS